MIQSCHNKKVNLCGTSDNEMDYFFSWYVKHLLDISITLKAYTHNYTPASM